jgi:hypothetical protein
MGVPGFKAEKLPTGTGVGPSRMALEVAMAGVRLARVSADYGPSVVFGQHKWCPRCDP